MKRSLALALVLICASAAAETRLVPFRARLSHVADGDSMVVRLGDGRTAKVRLFAIDAPEKGQAYANQSRQSLRRLTSGVELDIVPRDVDTYGRVVAQVYARGADVGLEQLRRGFVWHYVHYARQQSLQDRQAYSAAERSARTARTGLWQDARAVAPWKWRRRK